MHFVADPLSEESLEMAVLLFEYCCDKNKLPVQKLRSSGEGAFIQGARGASRV
jgi:hypothetical protein